MDKPKKQIVPKTSPNGCDKKSARQVVGIYLPVMRVFSRTCKQLGLVQGHVASNELDKWNRRMERRLRAAKAAQSKGLGGE
jgi:hypothetical protein